MNDQESKDLVELKALVKEIHRRLFYDNGSTSFQTRLSNHAQTLKLITWIGSALFLAIIGAVVKLWISG